MQTHLSKAQETWSNHNGGQHEAIMAQGHDCLKEVRIADPDPDLIDFFWLTVRIDSPPSS